MKTKKNKRKKIRVTGGFLKNRILHSVTKTNVRPTRNCVKQVLFNWLQNYIKDSICLDCFSGSGNLSIESVSRLAQSVIALEKNYILVNKLIKTIQIFSINNISVIHVNTIKWLRKNGKPFDIIYLDPPFNNKLLLNISIKYLEQYNWTHNNSIIYIEHIDDNIYIPDNWKLIKKKNIGIVSLSLFYKSILI
ncbi:Ribosomal RNA small subunit methyltransferase D [Buchnera aphidicola (Cinara kochiana kochiana)]|uniref:Ribosomal RNA small subunit methyltransferase D n=1 Tax=Buchnera aphidicola (Cinara kochiana kochiana) TaxID=2518976 RepID=A0A451D520_9GAMM|nr:16S rRNA (guanine(966)-N(2))-methyltransferase RsmD [Buchnera aphidicola]VFP80941.1 Ribosomal RNA small subunit methyltransferase D [Buchnera aphidicola (Cinara kochiana kochiana)]